MSALFAILFCASTSTTASALAAQSATGDIQGTIVSASGVVLADVTVTITNTATGFSRETLSNDAGFFIAPGLPVGPYELEASLPGFATQRQPDLLLQVGQAITVRLELRVARARETITVAAAAPMIDTTRSQVSSRIASAELQHVPVRDRNALNLAFITAGVTADEGTGHVSVAGQSGAFNRITWDGHERSRPWPAPHWISQEAAYGVQVSTNAYAAEYGGAIGGIINVVSNSGSNEPGGSVFGLRGNRTNEFSGSAGGPLARDRHFAYGIYDRMRHTAAHEQNLMMGRTDHRLSDTHRLSLRYNSESWLIGPEAASGADGSAHAFGATAMSAIGSTMFNDARLLVGRDRAVGEIISDAAVTRVQVADTLTWVRGAHKLKTGFDVQLDRPYVSESSLFVQDEWRLGQALTANLGVRYDAQAFAQSNYNNVGPRLGLAWAPVGTAFVVRGGYGIVYGRTPWPMVVLARGDEGIDLRRQERVAFDAGYEVPRAQQASTGFEWEWMPHAVFTVNLLMVRGDRLPRATGMASPMTTASPSLAPVVTYGSSGRLRYHGMTVEMTRRFAQGHQYRLSYTLGNVDDATPDGSDVNRSRFVGSATVSSNRIADRFSGFLESVVGDWTLSGVWTAQAGGRLPAWISLDPRIARDVELKAGARLTFFWEAFNLLDRPNTFAADMLFDTGGMPLQVNPLYGPALRQIDSRTMQVAVRFSF
jgi:hypothetical protein